MAALLIAVENILAAHRGADRVEALTGLLLEGWL